MLQGKRICPNTGSILMLILHYFFAKLY